MSTYQLPPAPDPVTGEPRPPAAPLTERLGRMRDTPTPRNRTPRNTPEPPPGMGPRLEWSQMSRQGAWTATLMYWGILSALFTLDAKGLNWIVGDVVVWAPMFALSWIVGFGIYLFDWQAAGAQWVQVGRKGTWVNTYQLTRIKFGVAHFRYRRVLRIRDAHGHQIKSLVLYNLQTNAAMWNLVYNGILHSVASGNCEVDAKASRLLKLPPELDVAGSGAPAGAGPEHRHSAHKRHATHTRFAWGLLFAAGVALLVVWFVVDHKPGPLVFGIGFIVASVVGLLRQLGIHQRTHPAP